MIGFNDLCFVLLVCCASIDTSNSTTAVIDSSTSLTGNSETDALSDWTATPVIDSSNIPVETSVTDSLSDWTTTPVIDSSIIPVETSETDALSDWTATPVIDSSNIPVETSVTDSLSDWTTTPVINSSNIPVETSVTDSISDWTTTPVIDSSTIPVETSVTDSLSDLTTTPVIDSSTSPTTTLVTDSPSSLTASSAIDSSYSPTPTSVTDSSTTITETATTQPPPTTQPPSDSSTSKPNLDEALFKLDLKIEVNGNFIPDLTNNTSPEYETWKQELITKLTPVYSNIPGFLYVEITGFSNGSVIGEYQVNIRANVPADDVQDAFNGTFLTEMNNLNILTFPVEPFTDSNDLSQIGETIRDKCQAVGICLNGFTCSGGTSQQVTCRSTCTGDDCLNGQCHVTSGGDRVCTCDISEDFIYSGDNCDIKTEKLSMEIGAIAGMAGGLGGGIILLLVIALVLACCSIRKNKNSKKYHSEDETQLTEFEEDVGGTGKLNPAADTRDEYGYKDAVGEDRSYQSWLMQHDEQEHGSKGQSRADDFRQTTNGGYRGSDNNGNESRERDQMEPAAIFGHALKRGSSGQAIGHYMTPDDFAPDYDSDDGQFDDEDTHNTTRDVESDRPLTRLPPGQSKPRPFKDDYRQEGHHAGNQPMKSQQRTFKDDYRQEGHADKQQMQPQKRLLSQNYKQGQPVYNHIETDETYAIRRPSFH
ncbi:interphotoreceptor matrix proteoglycan 2-like [Haliotis cracherodii]|uniref:interphotoreceptor matrix proteoglycan 2-like n=1 Tax=Haliotis cracherodii TaxID=6455 RepID=UPI0039E91C3B